MEAASCSGDVAAMEALVKRTHVCVTRDYCSGYWFPILNAARNGHHEAVRWLAQNGADPNQAVPTDGMTALVRKDTTLPLSRMNIFLIQFNLINST